MLKLTQEQASELCRAVRGVADLDALTAEIRAIYDRVQQAIDVRRPRCDISGRCCNFEQFGHRLFVTTAELAVFVYLFEQQAADRQATGPAVGGCPFQRGKLCGVHAIRPFGCRIFFCDPAAQEWQQAQYEQFHAELKALHEQLGIPYLYVEWREGLRAVGPLGEERGRNE